MVSKAMHVKQGDLCGGRADVHARCAEESGRAGVRAPIVASKRRNGRGAKGAQEGGCREARGEAPVRVPEGWSARPEPPAGRLDLTGADPHEDDIRPMPPEDMSGRLLRLELATLDRGQVSGSFFRIAVNHRPESRVREIRTHGSAGGGTGINRSSLPRSSPRLGDPGRPRSAFPGGQTVGNQAAIWYIMRGQSIYARSSIG